MYIYIHIMPSVLRSQRTCDKKIVWRHNTYDYVLALVRLEVRKHSSECKALYIYIYTKTSIELINIYIYNAPCFVLEGLVILSCLETEIVWQTLFWFGWESAPHKTVISKCSMTDNIIIILLLEKETSFPFVSRLSPQHINTYTACVVDMYIWQTLPVFFVLF